MPNTKKIIRSAVALSVILAGAGIFALKTQASDTADISSLQKQLKEVLVNQSQILSEIKEIKEDLHKIKIRIGPR
ncbi:MAG: hypothetical protein KC649_03090 [Candidatus Omnitrophica bacterium]|nr:hypothetical protein [Candidatus Omnitrophota bacterium]